MHTFEPRSRALSITRVVMFDVIETLLDLRALAPVFRDVLGDEAALDEFLSQMSRFAFALTGTGHDHYFASVARASLILVAGRRDVCIGDQIVIRVLDGLRSLPAHKDVPRCLARLHKEGFQLSVLGNSSPKVIAGQLRHAGILQHFADILSVNVNRAFKPVPEVYQTAARSLGVDRKSIRLVAAHSEAVGSALLAGCQGAFVSRRGAVLNPLFPRPDIVESNLEDVANRIIDLDVPSVSI